MHRSILKQFISDRTAWQKMLKNQIDISIDLLNKKNELMIELPEKLRKFVLNDNIIMNLVYPIKDFPQKVKSVSLDKKPNISGELTGIKGQYLYINKENVFNIRKHQGYLVDLNIN